MDRLAADLVGRIAAELERRADPERGVAMARYMRDQFPFLGVMSPAQNEAWKAATATVPRDLPEHVVVEAALALWDKPEREHQYLGLTLANRHAERTASPEFLATMKTLVGAKSWWDTVDALSTHGVGAIVRRDSELRMTMDEWLGGDELWLARSALLHMNRWKADTDSEWLFAACLQLSRHKDFFIRKAIGWALREYSKVDERSVINFVADHSQELSGLSRREALMWLERRRKRLGH